MPIALEDLLKDVSPDQRRDIERDAQRIAADNRTRLQEGRAGTPVGRPHRLATAIFSACAHPQYRDAILADLHAQFHENLHRHGPRRASAIYWLDTFRSIVPLLMLRTSQIFAPAWLSRHLVKALTRWTR
ncbi:permease prefix domain 2-containing transporter [Methylobacterium trifolii]|uniref:Uncharacterized protein n=1 Tax=Methylobacterium trifolii TaxID=1003092 RepID=A0ABQ4U0H6_9HYPH|nr:permease prefix domain 2-containing transporter [Methylobacterium trifolii]GJE59827.1 hypothetical protein MPOCJGCO_1929 [Methylobacterium trifolii]